MNSYPLTQFRCGHIGRVNEGSGTKAKVKSFIRVAHVGKSRLEESNKTCPDCTSKVR